MSNSDGGAALDDLDRRIVAALLQDGRASWRRIAAVVGDPERSVARRGSRLLEAGIVRVLAIPNLHGLGLTAYTLRVAVVPARLEAVAEELADRREVSWLSVLSSASACAGEAYLPATGLPQFLFESLCSIEGVTDVRMDPITRYHRTTTGWRPPILEREQQDMLGTIDAHEDLFNRRVELESGTRELIDALEGDGRTTAEDIANRLGVTKTTIGNRIARAIESGQLYIRGVVSPALLGFTSEAFVEFSPPVSELDRVGAAVARLPQARLCTVSGGRVVASVVAENALRIEQAVSRTLDEAPDVGSVRIENVAMTLKRTGLRFVDEVPAALAPRELSTLMSGTEDVRR